MSSKPNTVLITGAGSGIALQTALKLARQGYAVIATARSLEKLAALKAAAERHSLTLTYDVLDVTDAAQARHLADKYEIGTLLCSAANGETGPIAEEPIDRVRANYETNVFGTLQVIQAFIPQMIKRRSGRIVVLSSIVGLALPMFFNSYASTKSAIESLAGSLRNELKYFDIDVVIINPGRIHGGHNARIAETKYAWIGPESPYHSLIPEMKRHDRVLLDDDYPIEPVARDIVKAVQARRPRIRYASPFKYRFGLFLLRIMPTRMQDWLFFKADRLKFLK